MNTYSQLHHIKKTYVDLFAIFINFANQVVKTFIRHSQPTRTTFESGFPWSKFELKFTTSRRGSLKVEETGSFAL